MRTFWKAYRVYFPIPLKSSTLNYPLMRFEYLTEDWSEGQQSARRLTSMQNCTTVQCFMVHASYGVKAYQVNFPTQQTPCRLDFPIKSYD